MQRSTLTSKFLDGFTPSVLPPRGPHGMVPAGPAPVVHLPIFDPPSLCEAGPCRNYHRVVSEMEAQEAIGAPSGGGPRLINRSCYPTDGVEAELGDVPVFQCSRWEPETTATTLQRDTARKDYLKSDAGKKFVAEVAAYEAQVEKQNDAAVVVERPRPIVNEAEPEPPVVALPGALNEAGAHPDDADVDMGDDEIGGLP